jgi:hypothetical protein
MKSPSRLWLLTILPARCAFASRSDWLEQPSDQNPGANVRSEPRREASSKNS